MGYGFCWDNVPYEAECLASDAVSHPERVPTAMRILAFAKQQCEAQNDNNPEHFIPDFLEGLTDETPGLPADLESAIWEFPTLPELAYYLYAMEEIAGTVKWYREKIAAAVELSEEG